MPTPGWDDLRFLLAVARCGTYAAAARRVGVNNTTVSRRMTALQRALGVRLADRLKDGRLRLTAAGQAIARRAEAMEREAAALGDDLGAAGSEAGGTVRLTAVPVLVNGVLAPAAGGLLDRNPGLVLELVAEPRDLSLTRREADMALRLGRPRTGGARVKARRLGRLAYGAYAARGAAPATTAALPWISYDEAMAHLPQARWMARAAREEGAALARIRVNDAAAALGATAAGLGRSLLPRPVADADPRLAPIEAPGGLPEREVWLLVHADLAGLGRAKAVTGWLEEIFG